ncbi:hypothetical protein JKP88DRAFT_279033 [Tribonema minus]|uniref:Uncharacterized protein n=1 Tax=Tribonema minus TaxID=303371 RepID=A0A836CD09_9STRA|nr:hypothetical protein JKP88DRAFT_279033 [Tribonema minus]
MRMGSKSLPVLAQLPGAAATAAFGALASAQAAIAVVVDEEQVVTSMRDELPPMWVPLVLGAVVLAGIGAQQLSLGNVMDDEAKLGGLSGARAAKQSARGRSMFKRKK